MENKTENFINTKHVYIRNEIKTYFINKQRNLE